MNIILAQELSTSLYKLLICPMSNIYTIVILALINAQKLLYRRSFNACNYTQDNSWPKSL